MRFPLPSFGTTDPGASDEAPQAPKVRTIPVDENGKVKGPSAAKLKQVVEQSGKSTQDRIKMQQQRIIEDRF